MFDLQKLEVRAVIAGILLLIFLGLGYGTYYFHNKYVEAVTANGILKTQNDGYVATIKADSDSVAKLAADSKAREDAAKAAEAAAIKVAREYQKKAADLLAAQAKYPQDLCKSADALFNDYIGGK